MKLVCIKDCTTYMGSFFFENKIYEAKLNTKYNINVIIYGEDNHKITLNLENPFNMSIYKKHFVTLQEYRKLKLEKINEKSSM